MKKIFLLSSLLSISCSVLGKRGSEASRTVASVSPTLENQLVHQRPSHIRTTEGGSHLGSAVHQRPSLKNLSKKELIRKIRRGELVADSALYVKDKKVACFIDVRGKTGVTPDFVTPALRNFPVYIKPQDGIPSCGDNERNRLAYVSQSFVPAGTQMAFLPLVAGAVIGGGACIITYFTEFDFALSCNQFRYLLSSEKYHSRTRQGYDNYVGSFSICTSDPTICQ